MGGNWIRHLAGDFNFVFFYLYLNKLLFVLVFNIKLIFSLILILKIKSSELDIIFFHIFSW